MRIVEARAKRDKMHRNAEKTVPTAISNNKVSAETIIITLQSKKIEMRSKVYTLLYYIAFITLVINATSCDDPRTYDKYQTVSTRAWYRNDTLKFDIPRQWEGKYMLDIGVRTTKTFPYRGITFLINRKLISIKGKKKTTQNYRDTIRCQLIDNEGQVIGRDGISNNVFRSHIILLHLQRNDSMHITIQHNMSKDALQGVNNIGVRLTKAIK